MRTAASTRLKKADLKEDSALPIRRLDSGKRPRTVSTAYKLITSVRLALNRDQALLPKSTRKPIRESNSCI